MVINFEAIIYYLFLLDSLGAVIVALFASKWYKKKFKKLSKYIPLTKAWAILYLVLVLWIGCTLSRLGILPY